MIIVLTSLGLTTNDLNSTLGRTGARSPLSFMPVDRTHTINTFHETDSLHGTDDIYMDSQQRTSKHPIRIDNSDRTDLKHDIAVT